MQPVTVFVLPHNFRDEFYAEGEGPSFRRYAPGESRGPIPEGTVWLDLPAPMPACLVTITDDAGKVIAATADGKHVRWKDLDIVCIAVRQFNEDLARMGITPQPSPVAPTEALDLAAAE
jgi:hypothetical protein